MTIVVVSIVVRYMWWHHGNVFHQAGSAYVGGVTTRSLVMKNK